MSESPFASPRSPRVEENVIVNIPPWLRKFAFLKQTSITEKDIFLVGMTVVIGGQSYGWANAFEGGYWVALLALIIPALGYIVLTLCLAEMTSALPFSGGIYGFVRAFTSPIFGFLAATFELVVNIFRIAPTVYLLASLPIKAEHMDESLVLLNCFIVYIFMLFVLLVGGRIFWFCNTCLGGTVFVFMMIYIVGSSMYTNFDEWGAYHVHEFDGNILMKSLPLSSTVYLGIQFLPLTSRCAQEPRRDIPVMMTYVISVAVVFALFVLTCGAAQYPGLQNLTDHHYPLTDGFAHIFQISYRQALWCNLPFLLATAFGFLFCSGRQSSSMAKSGLLPKVFQQQTVLFDTPYVTLLSIASISFFLNILTYVDEDLIDQLFLTSGLASFLVFLSALASYIIFHKKYSSLERYFANPVGDWGAYLGLAIFAFCFLAGMICQKGNFTCVVLVIVIGVIAGVSFIFLAGEHVFSEEEKEELFKAYLVNANAAAKKRLKTRKVNASVHTTTGRRSSFSSPREKSSSSLFSKSNLYAVSASPAGNSLVKDILKKAEALKATPDKVFPPTEDDNTTTVNFPIQEVELHRLIEEEEERDIEQGTDIVTPHNDVGL